MLSVLHCARQGTPLNTSASCRYRAAVGHVHLGRGRLGSQGFVVVHDRSQGSCADSRGRFSAGQRAAIKPALSHDPWVQYVPRGHPEGRPGTVRQLACRSPESPLAAVRPVPPLAATGAIAPFWCGHKAARPTRPRSAESGLAGRPLRPSGRRRASRRTDWRVLSTDSAAWQPPRLCKTLPSLRSK